MGKLRNSSTNNAFGEGKEQIYTSDSGKTYRIKNSSVNNAYGEGKEKIIEETGNVGGGLAEIIPGWVVVLIWIIAIIIQKTCF